MIDFLADNFSSCVLLIVFLMAFCPMVESKVAIPLGLSAAIWADQIPSTFSIFIIALIGGFLPALFVVPFGKFIKNRTSGFIQEKTVARFSKRFESKIEKIKAQNTTFKKCVMLTTFVAVPLPLTGVWAGSLIGGLTNLKWWQVLCSVFVGEVVSCAVMVLLCLVFENSALYIFLISLALIALFVLFNLMLSLISKIKSHRKNREIEIISSQD